MLSTKNIPPIGSLVKIAFTPDEDEEFRVYDNKEGVVVAYSRYQSDSDDDNVNLLVVFDEPVKDAIVLSEDGDWTKQEIEVIRPYFGRNYLFVAASTCELIMPSTPTILMLLALRARVQR